LYVRHVAAETVAVQHKMRRLPPARSLAAAALLCPEILHEAGLEERRIQACTKWNAKN
jgi:hypothetical protein